MSDNPNLPSRIDMILLGVRDLARAVEFYRDTLAFQVQGQSGEFAFLAAGGISLVLSQPITTVVEPGPAAVEVIMPVESVAAARETLGRRNCRFRNEPHEITPGRWAATFTDPDGHFLTIMGAR